MYLAKVGDVKNKIIDKQTKEEKEIVRDKFDVTRVGMDLDQRAIERINQLRLQIEKNNDIEH